MKDWDERQLVARLLPRFSEASTYVAPDWGRIHRELDRKGVTLMLLWQVARSSSPRELTPQALTEPYVNLSIHTALLIRGCLEKQKSQWAKYCGALSLHRLSQAQDRRLCPRNRLYLFLAHRPSRKSILIRNRLNGSG